MKRLHRMPFGTEVRPDGTVRFRLWAPSAGRVDVDLQAGGVGRRPMAAVGDGWFEAVMPGVRPGAAYRFVIDDGMAVPDPASRWQPEGVHGPSCVVDPAAYDWADEDWTGRPWEETVLYELHVGAYTRSGRFSGVIGQLDHLAELGVTAVELMPVADAPGGRNWGYDGVQAFAPAARYGTPDDLKILVQSAHARGLMVFLDVVYNHFGPEGNYLGAYAAPFFTDAHHTPWGSALNFDGVDSGPVRDFFVHNALYWIEEFNIDGLRLDAVHAIFDDGPRHILDEIAERVRDAVPAGRHVHLVLENDANQARYLARDDDGRPRHYVAQWNDDIHHALHVLLTGESDGYYGDYVDRPAAHLARCLAEGFAYQGEASAYRGGEARGEASGHLPPTAFVSFLQNHDQIGNRAFGERLDALVDGRAVDAALAVLLLAPPPPMLFMGEEWAAPEPFLFFCDFEPGLRDAVTEGRRNEFARFYRFHDPAARARIPDPNAYTTFAQSSLDWSLMAAPGHGERLALVGRLLDLRQRTIVPRLRGLAGSTGEAAAFGDTALRAAWRLADGSRLVLAANLGREAADWPEPVPDGEVLFTTDGSLTADLADGRIGAWAVGWFLAAEPAEGGDR